ncbi:MAG: TetR/AcrR family transcriptional regulator [Rhizomicrobium sp.]
MRARIKTQEASPWIPFEDRRRARDGKRHAVLRMAVGMFLVEGYHRTTLSDVAARLNITKPALYNYFRSKEDILIECYRLGQQMYEASIAVIERRKGSGLEKLRQLIRAYVSVVTTDFGMCLIRLDDRELAGESRANVRRAKRDYDTAFRRQIARGIADGSIMRCDPKIATFAIVGALNWIGSWYQPDGELSVDAIAEEFAQRLTEGLAAR